MKRLLLPILAFSLVLAFSIQDASAAWPAKEIKLIIPFTPGGATDAIFRVTASGAEKVLGQTLVPVNMGGAGGSKGARFVKESKPDGYTILAGHDFLFTTYYGGLADFNYDAFEPVCLLTMTPNILAVHKDAPFNTFQEMVAYAKANPGKLSLTYSPASTGTLFFETLFETAKVDINLFRIVSINGTGPQVTNLLGKHVDLVMGNIPSIFEFVKDGRLKMLGVSHDKRLELIPDVPTFKELGMDFSFAVNRFIFVPKGTPREHIAALEKAYAISAKDPEVIKKIDDLGTLVVYKDSAEVAAFLKEQDVMYKKVFKK